jgi:regulator of sigma E protease
MPNFITFFVVPLILLIILILVHELGHFLAAKKSGIYVEEFGFGIPPRLFGIKWGETLYSLNALPIGGFVRLFGEEGELDRKNKRTKKQNKIFQDRAFYAQNIWIKSLVVSAGVLMNLLLAIVVFSVVYSVTGIPKINSDLVQIVSVESDSPAGQAGLQSGDVITGLSVVSGTEIQQISVTSTQQFIDFVNRFPGILVNIDIRRFAKQQIVRQTDPGGQSSIPDGQLLRFNAQIRENPPTGQGRLGVVISSATENVFYPFWQMPFRGTRAGIQEAVAWAVMIVQALVMMIVQLFAGQPPQVGGPVEIFAMGGQVAQMGLAATMRFLGVLSINLAVLNIMPIPALDGGRLAFIIWEGVTGKKVSPRVEHWIHSIGFALLITLIIFISVNDVLRRYGDSWLLSRFFKL